MWMCDACVYGECVCLGNVCVCLMSVVGDVCVCEARDEIIIHPSFQ